MESTEPKQTDSKKQKGDKVLIAGPCSAESREQIIKTARALAATGHISYFRAGAWKPRTSPGCFEGYGIKALEWLSEARDETGLKVCTEVGSVKHAELALSYGIDMLWIGARTVSNPFLVQEIADTLSGTGVSVMVKNPMAPDLDLWIGSIERIRKAGITDVSAIHRGFSYWTRSVFRNQPWWHIPSELKNRMPDINVICDPSHIAGRSELVPMLARRGLDMGMDGLMIEVHPSPGEALSDKSQQLTVPAFIGLIDEMFNSMCDRSNNVLEELRAEVDTMDNLLIWALTNRMKLAGEIAGVKSSTEMQLLQPGRWEKVLEKAMSLARDSGLRPAFIQKLFDDIHNESLSVQKTAARI